MLRYSRGCSAAAHALPVRRLVGRAVRMVGELGRPAPPVSIIAVLPVLQETDLAAGREHTQPVEVF